MDFYLLGGSEEIYIKVVLRKLERQDAAFRLFPGFISCHSEERLLERGRGD
jgi:hypothetical protein